MYLETIVLDLEKTLLSIFYKSTEITEYDDFTFMQIFGNSKVKVSYTTFEKFIGIYELSTLYEGNASRT